MEPRRGRDERRRVETLDAVVNLPEDILLEWPKLETVARVQSEALRAGKRTREMRYYITTLPMHQAEEIGSAVRSHWGIEN